MSVAARWAAWDRFAPQNPAGPFGGNETASTFPQTPLPAVIEIFINGEWVDVTSYVYARDGIQIRRGFRDESSGPEPGSMTLTLNNRDGRFSPRNTASPYYRQIGRNTPIRVRVELPYLGVDDRVRFVGEISEWPPSWDIAGRDVWVPVTAQGVLRRLNQGSKPVLSPLARAVRSDPHSLLAYWPMSDAGGQFASGLSGGYPITAPADVEFAADLSLLGSEALPVFGPAGSLTVPFQASSLNGSWEWSFFVAYPAAPAATVTLADVSVSGGTLARVIITASTTTVTVAAYNSAGTLIASASSSSVFGVLFGGDWALLNIYASTADTWAGVAARTAGEVVGFGVEAVDASITAGYPVTGTIPSSTVLNGAALGHMYLTGNSGSFPWSPATETGNVGQHAATRANMLITDAGVSCTIVGRSADSQIMGAQVTPSTFHDALEECWQADLARLFETRGELGLTFRTRRSHYNQGVNLALAYDGVSELANLEPVEDDMLTLNDVTVQRVDGSSARVVDSTSRMGTASPPDGVGTYDTTVTVNVASDDVLPHMASWKVHVGTCDEPRYRNVGIDLVALAQHGRTDLLAQVAKLDIGDRFVVTNLPAWLPPEDANLLALGFTETLGPFEWTVTIG